MGTIYALMVGINTYASPTVGNLNGCVTDIADATEFLDGRRSPDTAVDVMPLLDEQATGAAIVDGFRTHLTKAGPDDVALFWFSGHGSTEAVPQHFAHLESNGKWLQTLVCHDSRVEGRPDLLDKELALLLDEVAERGAHVVVVLDSCHSGGATRDGVTYRVASPAAEVPGFHLLPDLVERYADGPPPVRYVSLAACQSEEKAGESWLDGAIRGRFSWALLRAMRRARPRANYRELALLARNEVERHSATQRPLVYPPGHGTADVPVFGGAITELPTFQMRHGKKGWQINAGRAHGVAPGSAQFAVAGTEPPCEVDIITADVGVSHAAPRGWPADPDRVYPLVPTRAPRPVLFSVDHWTAGPADDDPYVRIVPEQDAELRVTSTPGGLQLIDRDNEQVAVLEVYPSLADLHHIGRWWRVLTLRNDDSRIEDAVLLEVVDSALDPDHTLRVSYELVGDHPTPPHRTFRLHNTADQPLYCVLLNLTERFKVAGGLFSSRIEANATAPVASGEAIYFELPVALANALDVEYRDWLLLIVSTDEIDANPYELDALDNTRSRDATTGRDLRAKAPVRDMADWTTSVLKIVTAGPRSTTLRSAVHGV